jgi:hypothetical protein
VNGEHDLAEDPHGMADVVRGLDRDTGTGAAPAPACEAGARTEFAASSRPAPPTCLTRTTRRPIRADTGLIGTCAVGEENI